MVPSCAAPICVKMTAYRPPPPLYSPTQITYLALIVIFGPRGVVICPPPTKNLVLAPYFMATALSWALGEVFSLSGSSATPLFTKSKPHLTLVDIFGPRGNKACPLPTQNTPHTANFMAAAAKMGVQGGFWLHLAYAAPFPPNS